MENNPIYKQYVELITKIESTMTNRTANKLDLWCRWYSVSNKDHCIHCSYGEGVCSLRKCIECYCDDILTINKLADDESVKQLQFHVKNLENGSPKTDQYGYDSIDVYGVKMWSKVIIEKLEKTLKEWIDHYSPLFS